MRIRREREHTRQECQVSKEGSDRQQLASERHRSRSSSGGSAGSVRGRQMVNQSDILVTGGASQNINMRNKGAEFNFYNLRNWVTKSQ